MKWFKHYSDLHRDDKIERLIARLGIRGYAMYVLTLELCAAQLDSKKPKTIFYLNYVTLQNVFRTKRKAIQNYFRTSSELEIWNAECGDFEVKIDFPKLMEIRDNHTKNLQVAGKLPDQNLPLEKNKKKNKKKNIKKDSDTTQTSTFNHVWEQYPRKVGKKPACSAFKKIPKSRHADFLQSVANYSKAMAGKDPQFILHMATFINQERWTEYINWSAPLSDDQEFEKRLVDFFESPENQQGAVQ